jgi:hypothetical protein
MSFSYTAKKGLEPIQLDVNSPASIAKVFYRVREIRRDLDRPLAGIIVNVAGKESSAYRRGLDDTLACWRLTPLNFLIFWTQ